MGRTVMDVKSIMPGSIEDWCLIEVSNRSIITPVGPLREWTVAAVAGKAMSTKTFVKKAFDQDLQALVIEKAFRVNQALNPQNPQQVGVALPEFLGDIIVPWPTARDIRQSIKSDWVYISFEDAMSRIVKPNSSAASLIQTPPGRKQ